MDRLRTAEAELHEASKREQVRTPGDVESASFCFLFLGEKSLMVNFWLEFCIGFFFRDFGSRHTHSGCLRGLKLLKKILVIWFRYIPLRKKNTLGLPSGKHTKNYRKPPFLMGKSTISMTIFNSYVSHNQRVGFMVDTYGSIYPWSFFFKGPTHQAVWKDMGDLHNPTVDHHFTQSSSRIGQYFFLKWNHQRNRIIFINKSLISNIYHFFYFFLVYKFII